MFIVEDNFSFGIRLFFQVERELVIQRKEEAKRDTRSKLLTMFSHALANRAATQRYRLTLKNGFDVSSDPSLRRKRW
jgi:hypothetical protein